jgi:RimJ/RimL family protein N-acetyltransferase
MSIHIQKATKSDALTLHKLQIKAFLPLLEKYQDHTTNPASEPIEKTLERISSSSRGFYKILLKDQIVGGIAFKIVSEYSLWIGPIFVDPDFQTQKIAQQALSQFEAIFPKVTKYELATLSKEAGNIHLHQKLGYKLTGRIEKLNDKVDLIFFEKIIS